MDAQGAIGLWGRIHVDTCPFCGGKHYHDGVEPGDAVVSGCGIGEYTLNCERPNTGWSPTALSSSTAAGSALSARRLNPGR